ncbi:TPA: GBS Bsp-like repeat-containing protein, partial [Streptococcus suis]
MKKTILFLSLCTLALSSQVVHADVENLASQNVVATDVANTGGQLLSAKENSQTTVLANVTGENTGETSQPSSTDAEPLSPLASQEKEDIDIPAQEVAVSEDSSVTSSMEPSTSTSTSTRSISSTITETSTAASSTQGETRLRSMPRSPSLSGNISVSNVNAQLGSFDVRVTNVSAPRGLSKVLVPTWTESNGQDDIIYHTADRQSDGSYKVTVPKSKHKYGTGKY